jgi:hypothetical protein
MAGNLQADNSGNILVDFDYNNIIVVDPNKTIDNFGNIRERLVDHENLVMYANLEAEVVPRTKLAVGGSPEDRIRTISVAKINFLKPTKNTYLGTGYYDELTGQNSTKFQGVNQPKQTLNQTADGKESYKVNSVADQTNVIDTGLLGMTSISIRTSTSFIPSVSITLEDVQGKALFQLGNNSPYAAFFNLPYCPFYLTLKGYYGQAIRYQLNLEKFSASFNSYSGNYIVNLEFKGYKFNILNEISFGHLLAAPHMYSQRFQITQSPTEGQNANESKDTSTAGKSGIGTTSTTNVTSEIVAERGYQKVVEVYSEYKAKGLVSRDFPELTVQQLMNKLDNFEQAIVNSYQKANVEPLTNIRNYQQKLKDYFANVRGADSSWFNTYCDVRPIYLKDKPSVVYAYKANLDQSAISEANTKLSDLVARYNIGLAENPTLGKAGTSPIANPIKYDDFFRTIVYSNIDWIETTRSQTGIIAPTEEDVKLVQDRLSKFFKVSFELNIFSTIPIPKEIVLPKFLVFEGDKGFDKTLANMETQANAKLAEIEGLLSADLARKIEDKATGLGFRPTVRNIIAVLMASSEAFIRLLDDVHTNAWNVKYDPIRKNAILDNPSSAQSSDSRDDVKISTNAQESNQGLSTSQIPVYPWPQFFVETPEDKKGRFQLKYIADPSVVNLTKGYLYEKWPEVEFVEEYMKGLTQKFQNPLSQPSLDAESTTIINNVNAIEFPNVGIAYVNKEEIKFFYEIWERQYLTSFYSGYVRLLGNNNGSDVFAEYTMAAESQNIKLSLGASSPYLNLKLKNLNLNSANYVSTLETISNQGTGRAYQDFIRDFYVTPYIKTLTESPFSILKLNETGKIPKEPIVSEALQQIVTSPYNTPMLLDTYPFTDGTWCFKNMDNSAANTNELVYNTNKTYKIYSENKVIANFDTLTDYTTNRPVTNFSYLSVSNPSDGRTNVNLNEFYATRETKNFIPTEGYCYFPSPNTTFETQTTTSILNTPYFINAIQNGVNNSRKSDPYPYVQAAYLFINSLPLASTRERYKTYSQGQTTDLDYIASVFKKFGAIHKVPYVWVLKMGSIWHRYKKHVETNVDILDSCWKEFDYVVNYDPITNDINHKYSYEITVNGKKEEQNIVLQNETTTSIKIQNGFYPKLVNDFNVFYNGYELYQTYSDKEIQASLTNGMKLFSLSQGSISGVKQKTKDLIVEPFSVVIPHLIDDSSKNQSVCVPANNTKGGEYYVIPSFGNTVNQTATQCINTIGNTIVDLTYNQSMYNGSVRLLWSAPNYGYFDSLSIRKPSPDSYLNYINPERAIQAPMRLLSGNTYSKIEEIFSVFDKSILNQFEQEFLNFCKPISTLDAALSVVGIGQSPIDINANFKNFQSFMRIAMTVPSQTTSEQNDQYFQNTINSQAQVFCSNIKNFMEYDVILRNGNPGNYNRRIFGSFLGTATDPIRYEPYVKNSLPTLSGGITLSQSKAKYPLEWVALQTTVGFSTIANLEYSDKGSYITDFFVDNNMLFSVPNINLYSELIKIYATRKLLNPTITTGNFRTQIQNFISNGTSLQNIVLNRTLESLRKNLEGYSQLPERTIQSVIDGQQSKVENYEVFKALNDKWVAGGDYKTKTLFEDMMFLDRASRNIGDTIIIDIFDLQSMLGKNAYSESMSVFTLISGILIKNNFTVMPLPAYVNFYNVQDVSGINIPQKTQGSLEFANSMWGTYLNVDYRNSGPKMICFYAGKPSQYLDLPKGNFRFRDDSFEMKRASENPLIEDLKDKKDFGLSNRCVGFNVEIGTRNQNVFYSFSVSQDAGKATSEAINAQLNMIDQASGRNVATQNVSLYNLYKNRSYTCTIQCLGNALLQPTMYFNLQHVPMFNGPYMITDISHNITPGNFETTITGVRQGIFDLPAIDSFLQSINQNLLTKIEQAVLNKKDATPTPGATTDQSKAAKIIQEAKSEREDQNTCSNKLNPIYTEQGWASTTTTATPLSEQLFKDAIVKKTSDSYLQTIIYTICYVRVRQGTKDTNSFVGFNNNFATVTLDIDYVNNNIYFNQTPRTYSCVNVQSGTATNVKNILPIANFSDINKFLDFMISKLTPNIQRITQIGLPKYYVCYWPTTNFTEEYYETKKGTEFKAVIANFESAIKSAISLGLSDLTGTYEPPLTPTISATIGSTPTATSSVTPTPTPTVGTIPSPTPTPTSCEKPVIISFTPTFGGQNTILTITGKYLQSTTSITINNVIVTKGITKSNDGTQLTVTVPQSQSTSVQSNTILVKTQNGDVTSTNKFTYDPASKTTSASAAPLNTTNVSQQTQTDIATSTSSTRQDGQAGPKVLLETETNGLKGMEKLVISINPETTGWRLNPQADLKLLLVTNKRGPNNTRIQSKSDIKKTALPGYVTDNLQEFEIDNVNVINIALDYFTQEELDAAAYLTGQVDVIATSLNGNNPQTYYTASFVIYFNT